MAPIFASDDIAALVAAFPPPSPTIHRPSFVRQLTGNTLIDSREVLARFRELAEIASARIKLTDLPARLGIGTTDWLLECLDSTLCYSGDGRALIPQAETETMVDALSTRARDGVVDLALFGSENDIAPDSLARLIQQPLTTNELLDFVDRENGGKRHVYSPKLAKVLEGEIRAVIVETDAERLELDRLFAGVPYRLLEVLALRAMNGDSVNHGHLEVGDGQLFFVPSGYEISQQNKRREAYDSRVDNLTRQLEEEGFCLVSSLDPEDISKAHENLERDVSDRYAKTCDARDRTESIVRLDSAESQGKHLVVSSRLIKIVNELKPAAMAEVTRIWKQRDGTESPESLTNTVMKSLAAQSASPDLASLVLASPHAAEIEATIASSMDECKRQDTDTFRTTFGEHLLAPLHLHAAGIARVSDATLKQHLEEFTGEHFRRAALPDTIALLHAQRALLDKPRAREVEKLQHACHAAATLAELHAAVSKFCRKQTLAAPTAVQLRAAQAQALRRHLRAMRALPRASDLLQHLLWILLARRDGGDGDDGGPALFMSAGRDTSRMIKQYRSLGGGDGAEADGARLEAWRDALKAGRETSEDLREMREMAVRAVEEMDRTAGDG